MTQAEKDEKTISKLIGKVVYAKKGEHLAKIHQVARWLAEGNGQCCHTRGSGYIERGTTVATGITYQVFETVDFPGDLAIRKWDDTKWHEPTLEYMEVKNA